MFDFVWGVLGLGLIVCWVCIMVLMVYGTYTLVTL